MATTTSRPGRLRRVAERLLLGSVMALMAMVVDRRLRRFFAAQRRR